MTTYIFRTYSLKEEAVKIMEKIPSMQRSKTISNLIIENLGKDKEDFQLVSGSLIQLSEKSYPEPNCLKKDESHLSETAVTVHQRQGIYSYKNREGNTAKLLQKV